MCCLSGFVTGLAGRNGRACRWRRRWQSRKVARSLRSAGPAAIKRLLEPRGSQESSVSAEAAATVVANSIAIEFREKLTVQIARDARASESKSYRPRWMALLLGVGSAD